MLGCQAVINREYRAARQVAQLPANDVVRLQIPDDMPATMVVDQRGKDVCLCAARRPVTANRDRPARPWYLYVTHRRDFWRIGLAKAPAILVERPRLGWRQRMGGRDPHFDDEIDECFCLRVEHDNLL